MRLVGRADILLDRLSGIMGANIGTTVTSFIIGFKLGSMLYHTLIFLGTMFLFFTKNRTANNIGRILFGVRESSTPLTSSVPV